MLLAKRDGAAALGPLHEAVRASAAREAALHSLHAKLASAYSVHLYGERNRLPDLQVVYLNLLSNASLTAVVKRVCLCSADGASGSPFFTPNSWSHNPADTMYVSQRAQRMSPVPSHGWVEVTLRLEPTSASHGMLPTTACAPMPHLSRPRLTLGSSPAVAGDALRGRGAAGALVLRCARERYLDQRREDDGGRLREEHQRSVSSGGGRTRSPPSLRA
jgi:hypothetical protein